MFETFKIWQHQGKQFIPDVTKATLTEIFRGRPEISTESVNEAEVAELCPTSAILTNPMRIDLGRCTFCGECELAYPKKIKFTNDHKIAANTREALIVKEGDTSPIKIDANAVRKEIKSFFGNSLKLRQVSAGGDSANEWELGACSNVNFDMSRFGIDFVASPRQADGIVITGAISTNMAEALQITYDAMPFPKLIILVGTEAISGGIFEGSPAIDRSFLDKYKVDLYVPGNPIHPLTFINGILTMIAK
ncbi:MAG: NADH:ubiquinone oxidoreductase [Cytophagales bacterium]|nr:MAG: NADH:ubiquinone oxidoreductase [Cytophagales bacterium]